MEDLILEENVYFMANLKLTGVTHNQIQQAVIRNEANCLTLAREPCNEFNDYYAVMVLHKKDGSFIGWIPRGPNIKLATAIDCGRVFDVLLHQLSDYPNHSTTGLIVNIVEA